MRVVKRFRVLWAILILAALCTVGWAVVELSGQANKSAADAGMISADMEMASLDTITKPAADTPNIDWQLERRLRNELQTLDKNYKAVAARSQSEIGQTGEVSAATGKNLMAAATKFRDSSEKYAVMWEKGNCITRAKLARETGASRMASAELIVSGADSDKADALQAQQKKMNEARKAYIEQAMADNEISEQDKANMKANLLPKAQKLVQDTSSYVSQVGGLLNDVRSQATPSGLIGGLGGCAASSVSSTEPMDPATQLLGPVTSLLSLAKGLASNAGSLLDDVTTLVN